MDRILKISHWLQNPSQVSHPGTATRLIDAMNDRCACSRQNQGRRRSNAAKPRSLATIPSVDWCLGVNLEEIWGHQFCFPRDLVILEGIYLLSSIKFSQSNETFWRVTFNIIWNPKRRRPTGVWPTNVEGRKPNLYPNRNHDIHWPPQIKLLLFLRVDNCYVWLVYHDVPILFISSGKWILMQPQSRRIKKWCKGRLHRWTATPL